MSAEIETSIWLALRSRINSFSESYTKAWPGQTFEMPNSAGKLQPYLRIGRVSVAPVRQLIASGKPHRRTGSLMVTLVHPMTATNVSVYDQKAAAIAKHFKDGTKMIYAGVCVEVTSYPHVQEGYEDFGYWTVPVRIPWQCFA